MAVRLLVVENEAALAKDLTQALCKWGYEIAGLAFSGGEVLRLFDELHPDLILITVELDGDMDGIETIALLDQQCPIPVIYLAADAEEPTLQRALQTRPFAYLVKPVADATLRAAIKMAVHTQQRILGLNADLSAQVVENARLYEEERRQRELAEILVRASEALITSLDVDVVLDLIIEQVGRIIPNDVCNIVLIDDDQNSRVVRSCGYETFNADVFIETFIFPLSGLSIRNEIIKTGQAVVAPDVFDDPRWARAGAAWLRSYIAAPIMVQKKMIGLINVGSSLPDAYGAQQAAHLQTFAYQAAVAFQNARFFEEAQENAKRLQSLSHQLINIQETERRYIARELHDEIGQALTAASMILQGAQSLRNAGLLQKRLTDSLSILNLALQQVRKISLDLHPSMLDDLGLVPALRWYADREASWSNFQVQVQAKEINDLSDEFKLVCFRVAQEALTNISRHAQAQHVTIQLWEHDGSIHLTIQDDGQGFNVQEALNGAAHGRSLGLLGMKERVLLAGGELEIASAPNSGTEIHAQFCMER